MKVILSELRLGTTIRGNKQDELTQDRGETGLFKHEVSGNRWKQSGAGHTLMKAGKTHKGRKKTGPGASFIKPCVGLTWEGCLRRTKQINTHRHFPIHKRLRTGAGLAYGTSYAGFPL